jgi:hypothetical protein
VSSELTQELLGFQAEIERFRIELRRGFAKQRRWMLFFWATTLLEIVALKLF